MQKASGPLVPLHWVGLGCATLVASGRFSGCAKSSALSSAAGLLGGLASLGAYQLSQDLRNIWVFLVISGTLNGIIGMRFHHSGWIRPVGLILGASLLTVTKLGISVLNRSCQ
ncbi:transmembrane protein 14C-like [Lontra canadensis]|uniref:transmembrane protein 14C-like n=1 Tax=Lontra canadensis TaxID=76717 RepID=UPI0013F2E80D|nr:transmembrane protein 14C-like [Lontra canadensis]